MQNAETVLGVLRERGRRGLPCDELYRQLFNPQMYLLAYGRIYSNKGAMTPAIALTAFAMTRDERASSLAGFDAHVAKPLSAQTLIETICSVCEVGNTH